MRIHSDFFPFVPFQLLSSITVIIRLLSGYRLVIIRLSFGYNPVICFPFLQSNFIKLFEAGLQCECIWTFLKKCWKSFWIEGQKYRLFAKRIKWGKNDMIISEAQVHLIGPTVDRHLLKVHIGVKRLDQALPKWRGLPKPCLWIFSAKTPLKAGVMSYTIEMTTNLIVSP